MKINYHMKTFLSLFVLLNLNFASTNAMNLVKKIENLVFYTDCQTSKILFKILFDQERDPLNNCIALFFLYGKYSLLLKPAKIYIYKYGQRSYLQYLTNAFSSIRTHFNLENPNFYKRFFISEKTNPIVDGCFKKIIDYFGKNPKEDVIVEQDYEGKKITNTFYFEDTKEEIETIEDKILGYQLKYEKNFYTDTLDMMRYIFEKLELYTKYDTFFIHTLPVSHLASMLSNSNLKNKTCEIWIKKRPFYPFEIFDSLIHEFCHIEYDDSSVPEYLYNKERAIEFRANSWIPQNFKQIAKMRFYAKIINLGLALNKTAQFHTFYPAPLEDYVLSRTMYKENFDNPKLFYTDLYNVHPALVQMDAILMNQYEKNKDKMFIAPQLIEDIRIAKQEYAAQQYEYGYNFIDKDQFLENC